MENSQLDRGRLGEDGVICPSSSGAHIVRQKLKTEKFVDVDDDDDDDDADADDEEEHHHTGDIYLKPSGIVCASAASSDALYHTVTG